MGCPDFLSLMCLAASCGAVPERAEWAADAGYRIEVVIHPGKTLRHHTPVGVSLDFGRLFKEHAISGRIDANSIRVVRCDPQSGRAIRYSGSRTGYDVPHYLSGDLANDDAGAVWWRIADPSATHYHIYFDSLANGRKSPPAVLGPIGVGDRLHFNDGQPGFVTMGELDWDGDGLPDLIYPGIRVYEPGVPLEERLGFAVYFRRNVGTSEQPVYAPPYRVKAADGSYLLGAGHLYQNMFPFDWDGDGRIDFLGFRGNQLVLMENAGMRDRNGLWLLKQPSVARELGISQFRETLPGVLGKPSFYFSAVSFADWEGDGDEDMIATASSYNETARVDARTGVVPFGAYLVFHEMFENVGRDRDRGPRFARPVAIHEERGLPIASVGGAARYLDWDGDGDCDLLVYGDGDRPLEGYRLEWAENVGTRDKPVFMMPVLAPPQRPLPKPTARRTAQEAHPLLTAFSVATADWDRDSVPDLVCGSYSDHILFHRNHGTLIDPVFDRGVPLEAGGKPIYMTNWLDPQAADPSHWGPQGPAEPAAPCMLATPADWDADADLDLFVTGQRWQTLYFENIGSRTEPRLAAGREVRCAGDAHEFAWRSRVASGDLDGDGQPELVALCNHDGLFHAYSPAPEQDDPKSLELRRGAPLLLEDGQPIEGIYIDANNNGDNNALLADWDGDGDLDLFVGYLYGVWYFENTGRKQAPRFKAHGRLQAAGKDLQTYNHAGAFDVADWNGDGRLDLLMGSESPSTLHLFDRTFLEGDLPSANVGAVEKR
jgi:hypothetical protein